MLALLLKVLGFLGLGFAGFNAYLKIFANDEQLIAYAGSTRNLDMNFTVLAISLIFVALGKIIDNTNPPETD